MLRDRLIPAAVVTVVVLAIATGLIISGSPLRQRELKLDDARVANLRSLSNAVSRYYQDTGSLPDSLAELVDGRTLSSLPRDPVSGADYGYRRSGPAHYSLCADFVREADTTRTADFWDHAAGMQCFAFDYSDRRLGTERD